MKNTKKIYKMRIVFRLLEQEAENKGSFYAVRKMVLDSGLPYEPAKINPNWPRISCGPTPAKGQRAEREYLDIYLRELCSAADVRGALEQVAPSGLELLSVERVPYPLPSVQNLAAAVRYRVKGAVLASAGQKIEDWAGAGCTCVKVQSPDGAVQLQELAPQLVEVHTLAPDEVELMLAGSEGKWVPASWVIAAWLGREVCPPQDPFAGEGIVFIRQCFYWKDSQGEYHPM